MLAVILYMVMLMLSMCYYTGGYDLRRPNRVGNALQVSVAVLIIVWVVFLMTDQ